MCLGKFKSQMLPLRWLQAVIMGMAAQEALKRDVCWLISPNSIDLHNGAAGTLFLIFPQLGWVVRPNPQSGATINRSLSIWLSACLRRLTTCLKFRSYLTTMASTQNHCLLFKFSKVKIVAAVFVFN